MWVARACTLSPHFVSTLCRLRFVPTLCHYALSSHRTRRSGATRMIRRSRAAVSGALSRSRSRSRPRPRPRPRGPVLPILPGLPVLPTGIDRIDRWRQDRWPSTNAAQCGADIPVCARLRGQTGMSAPHYHAPSRAGLAGTASPYLCLRAFAGAVPVLDDNRPRRSSRQTDAVFQDYIPPLQG
jgi:hypothetical protein